MTLTPAAQTVLHFCPPQAPRRPAMPPIAPACSVDRVGVRVVGAKRSRHFSPRGAARTVPALYSKIQSSPSICSTPAQRQCIAPALSPTSSRGPFFAPIPAHVSTYHGQVALDASFQTCHIGPPVILVHRVVAVRLGASESLRHRDVRAFQAFAWFRLPSGSKLRLKS